MSIRPDYFKYLDHFGRTVTIREFASNSQQSNLIALRHDIDHDLDLALEMSYWEHEQGIRSSYYLLHTAPYWQDERLLEKCLQIQDFGHEIGLHLNVLSQWVNGEIENVALQLKSLVTTLREAGLKISGISPHGDRKCYEHGFINYWCFTDLKPADLHTEAGLSAEGISVRDPKFRIPYPTTHQLVRSDGSVFPLWSVSMRELGLDYDAIHVPYDYYYTDSGGSWKRSDDPLQRSLQSGRHQVLIHPIYWQGEKKIYFFLSTARSGSTWLANFLEQATPLKARHEFTLNHRFEAGQLIAEKRTAEGFTALVDDPSEVRQLGIAARAWIEEFSGDYAEANVYLERFPDMLREVFPDAQLIHLHRRPAQVVRSLMNRDWYDTPEDTRHPIMAVEGWQQMDQFEQICWYVRQTNESLLSLCTERLMFEKMVRDMKYLSAKLKHWGIPVFPRLASLEFEKKLNQNKSDEFPAYQHWSIRQKALFHQICDPIAIALGYTSADQTSKALISYARSLPIKLFILRQKLLALLSRQTPKIEDSETLSVAYFGQEYYKGCVSVGCQIKQMEEGMEIYPEGGKNAYVLLKGGQWYELQEQDGWESQVAHYYRGTLETDNFEGAVQCFCLMYDDQGKLMAKRSLGQVQAHAPCFKFAFRSKSKTERFNIAIYMPASNLPKQVRLKSFRLEQVSLSIE